MIYEISLKIRIKKEERERSYFEAWRIEGMSFMPYEQPILERVFLHEWPLSTPPPEPSTVYMVLVKADNSSTKEMNRVFTRGRNCIRNYLAKQEVPTFLVMDQKEAE